MQLSEIEDNIVSRRNRIFLLMEEVRRLRIQRRLKVKAPTQVPLSGSIVTEVRFPLAVDNLIIDDQADGGRSSLCVPLSRLVMLSHVSPAPLQPMLLSRNTLCDCHRLTMARRRIGCQKRNSTRQSPGCRP